MKPQIKFYTAFTHAGLTTRYRTKRLYISIFVLTRLGDRRSKKPD